jgi:hypothetical protein
LTSSEEVENSDASNAKKNYPATSANQTSLISCIGKKFTWPVESPMTSYLRPSSLAALAGLNCPWAGPAIGRLVADSHVAHGSELGNSASGADLEKKIDSVTDS